MRFVSARFKGNADFSSIQSERSFSLHGVRFERVPDFNEANFHEPPVLDDIAIKDQLTEKGRLFRSVERPERNAKFISRNFRKLGKMAQEGRDWLNEMEFFAQEIRTRRFGLDFPVGEFRWLRSFFAGAVHPGRGKGVWKTLSRKTPDILRKRLRKAALFLRNMPFSGATPGRFWFGLFYEKLSNFGRSFVRPLVLLALSTLLFALLYYVGLAETKEAEFTSALTLSFRQSLVISGLLRLEHYSELLKSLFGAHLGNWAFLWLNVQTIWSAFLWFLFFLALRNHFRIR